MNPDIPSSENLERFALLGGRSSGRTQYTLRALRTFRDLSPDIITLLGTSGRRNTVKTFDTNEEFITEAIKVVELIQSWDEVTEVCIGGSLAIHMYGHDLGRKYGDLDLTICSTDSKAVEEKFKKEYPVFHELSHMTDFNHQAIVNGIKCDIAYGISNYHISKSAYKGSTYSLVSLKKIIAAKAKYAAGNCGDPEKHLNDIMKLINSQPKPTFTFG